MLSFEHVPPSAAFNSDTVIEADIKRIFSSVLGGDTSLAQALENPRGRQNQKGAGAFTLCEPCNNNTGAWYVDEYVSFTKALYDYSYRVPSGMGAALRLTTKPLNVIKQILTMFCSACPPEFSKSRPDVVRYLLNRESRAFPHDVRLWAALYDANHSTTSRQSGVSVVASRNGTMVTMSEICFPPFVFAMTLDYSRPFDPRMQSLNYLRHYDYNQIAEIPLSLSCLTVKGILPGEYLPSINGIETQEAP